MSQLESDFENKTIKPGTDLLIPGPALTGKRWLALETLTRGADSGEESVLIVARDSPDRALSNFRAHLGDPDNIPVGIVDCVTRHQGCPGGETERVKYAASPTDTTGIGVKFSEFVDAFTGDRGVTQLRTAVDSLSTLLLYSDTQTVFQFGHVLTSRIEDAG